MSLFNKDLIPASIHQSLPAGYICRPLQVDDFNRGVLDVLSVLTQVGGTTKQDFEARFNEMLAIKNTYFIVVFVNKNDRVIAVGSVIMEKKFIRSCGTIGHIEDIAVAKSEQGKSIGKKLIDVLTHIGEQQGAYKVILDCSDSNVKFYERCGYKLECNMMAIRFPIPSKL
ncbi:acyl-CoA N-acyltransferase [Nadsonia fulvescens var. elongata DSM 6958]|uniref:Glucosamine 6-phosphate N-acetyltransferase n=1 Tax=Nadsonia fulvescens var. elongata DSM 6958 TaxID=857566 RepID=A0A1E3PNP0_9ASCO|nr:acyl-CoA N-acyltransferase [Nadsonia fulvescens var. elongata DSM 6958]